MTKKTILVTGGNGFIGKNIRESLRNRFDIIALSHEQLDLLSQDAVDDFFHGFDVDYVIHCANVGGNRKFDGTGVVEKNVRMFCNLARNSGCFEKMITFGSGAEYDKTRALVRISEKEFGERIPPDEYGFSKYLISSLVESSQNVVCLRLFGCFGIYEDYEYKFISNAIIRNLFGMPIHIRQNVVFDWLYVEDLMKIIPRFLNHDFSRKTYNITPNMPTDLVTISHIINATSLSETEIIVDNLGLNNEYTGSNSCFIKDTGDFQFASMSKAISELFTYYEKEISNIDEDIIVRDEYAANCVIKN